MRKLISICLTLLFLCLAGAHACAEGLLTFPQDLTIIEEQAFMGDPAIRIVVLPEGVTTIRSRAFANSGIERILLPASITSISDDAFSGCNGLVAEVYSTSYAYIWCTDNNVTVELLDADALRPAIVADVQSAIVGESITWTASVEGGIAPCKYLFDVFLDDEILVSGAYSTSASCTHVFTRAGVYHAVLKVKDDNGDIASVQSSAVTVSPTMPVITGISCDRTDPLETTQTASWTVDVSDGEAPYRYAFTLLLEDEPLLQTDPAGENTFAFTFADDGDYRLLVTVTDAWGQQTSAESTFTVALHLPEIVSITHADGIALGESITVDITAIGYRAFFGASTLTSVTIPQSVTSIGSQAFYGASGLTQIVIPGSVTSVGSGAFKNCAAITRAVIPGCMIKGNTTAGSTGTLGYYFDAGLREVVIAENVTEIGQRAFADQTTLISVSLPAGLATIHTYAFSGCTALSGIDIPDSVSYIDSNAFRSCTSLTAVALPRGITDIYSSLFAGCTSLTEVIIPDTVTKIGNYAFNNCKSLTLLTVPDSVQTISSSAFTGCSSLTIRCTQQSEACTHCKNYGIDFELIPDEP